MRAALRPATPASPFPCVQLVPAGKSSSPPASIAGPVRPDVPAPAAGSILGTSRAAGDPSLGAERLTPVFYSVHVFLMFVFMLKPECCSIRGADTSCLQQAVLVPSGLHFPLLGRAAREGWGCSLPKPHFWGLSWPLLLGCRGCSPQPLAVRGRSDTWALSQAFSVSCFCPGVLQWDLDPPALLPWLAACPVPSPPLLYSRGGAEGRLFSFPGPAMGELVPHAGTWPLSCCPLRRDRGRSRCLRALHLLVRLELHLCPVPSPIMGSWHLSPVWGQPCPSAPETEPPGSSVPSSPLPRLPPCFCHAAGSPGKLLV